MNKPNPDDIISACFDNELSAEERHKAEELLAESSDALEELEETDQLSRLLKSLPLTPAPSDLASSVMDRIGGDAVAVDSSTAVASTTTVTRRFLNWKVAIGTLAAAIAAMVVLPRLPVNDQNAGHQIAEAEKSDLKTAAIAESAEESSVVSADVALPESEVATKRSEYESGNNGRRAKMATPAKPMPAESSGAAPEFADNEMREPSHEPVALYDIDWTNVKIGDMKLVLARPQDKVAVIEVTVVDIQKAVSETQYLLNINSIPGYDDDIVNKEDGDGGSVPESMILYVEAPEERLNTALQSMSANEMLSTNTIIAGRSIDPNQIDVVALNSPSSADFRAPTPTSANGKPASKSEAKSDRTTNRTRRSSLSFAIQSINRVNRPRSYNNFLQQQPGDEEQLRSKDKDSKESNSATESDFAESKPKNGLLIAPLPADDDTFQMLLQTPSLTHLKDAESDDAADDIASTIDKIAPRPRNRNRARTNPPFARKKLAPTSVVDPSAIAKNLKEGSDKPKTVASTNVRVLFVFKKPESTSVPADSDNE